MDMTSKQKSVENLLVARARAATNDFLAQIPAYPQEAREALHERMAAAMRSVATSTPGAGFANAAEARSVAAQAHATALATVKGWAGDNGVSAGLPAFPLVFDWSEVHEAGSAEVGSVELPARGAALPRAIEVSLQKSPLESTEILPMLVWINKSVEDISFDRYVEFVNRTMSEGQRGSPACVHGSQAYELLKTLTESFLLMYCRAPQVPAQDGVVPDELSRLQTFTWSELVTSLGSYLGSTQNNYIDLVLTNAFGVDWRDSTTNTPLLHGIVRHRFGCPCLLELIWSYWCEEAGVAQAMNAISLRFQNIAVVRGRKDPLGGFEVDPLRGLSNLLWGFVQDERGRTTVTRRAHEYDHQYGLRLYGKAVRQFRPADSRSKFIEAFHFLLNRCAQFFREDADTTVRADGFPVLNAIKEVHLVLAFGAHNQFGDMAWRSRVELMMQMWLLGRPEMRDFLGARVMVPYRYSWMGPVDEMKKLQGWTDVSVTHFQNLATFGEKLLLSIRFGNWSLINDASVALTWCRYWQAEIQGYIHAYRVATGVDLTADASDDHGLRARNAVPAEHLRRRLTEQFRLVGK